MDLEGAPERFRALWREAMAAAIARWDTPSTRCACAPHPMSPLAALLTSGPLRVRPNWNCPWLDFQSLLLAGFLPAANTQVARGLRDRLLS